MSKNLPKTAEIDDGINIKNYVVGYGLSIVITLIAYISITKKIFGRTILITEVAILALIQFLVQVIYFLHLGKESKPRWKLAVFLFMLGVVVILIGGSIWIMVSLNYHMTPKQVNNYMSSQDGI